MTAFRICVGSVLCMASMAYAGSKELCRATSPVVSIAVPKSASKVTGSDDFGFYVGLGLGWMRLKDNFTREFFKTYPVGLLVGYRINRYISLEARYIRDVRKVRYQRGITSNPNYDDYPTIFSNKGIYLKPSYRWGGVEGYALLGYGELFFSNIKGAKRYESSLQWGGGLSYNVADHFELFADYTRLYDGKGFGGRARKKQTHADAILAGVVYVF